MQQHSYGQGLSIVAGAVMGDAVHAAASAIGHTVRQ